MSQDVKIAQAIALVNDSSFDELAPLLKAIAEKVYAWRCTNRGYVPISVFENLLGPVTVSVQIVHEVRDVHGARLGYALRLRDRDAGEAGDAYHGLYHNTCTSLRWLDTIDAACERNNGDAFCGMYPSALEYLGVTYHHEIPRHNMIMTFMHRRVIRKEHIPWMNGVWKLFTDDEIRAFDPRIIPSNLHQLIWAMSATPQRETPFNVLKETFPKELLT